SREEYNHNATENISTLSPTTNTQQCGEASNVLTTTTTPTGTLHESGGWWSEDRVVIDENDRDMSDLQHQQ
ncbi:hypothetical protein Pmar_PMAR028705, partial [Perkinsus marinus ATCC 50983]